MKILVYGINCIPEPVGVGKFTGEMAQWLAAEGAQVRVVTAQPSYPAWRPFGLCRPHCYSSEEQGSLQIRRCPVLLPAESGAFGRLLFLLSFALSSIPQLAAALWWRPDVLICVQPTMVAAPLGWAVSRLCGAVAWLHVQDLELDLGARLGFGLARRLYPLARRFESWLLRHFDELSSICTTMAHELSRRAQGRRVRLVPNWADPEAFGDLGDGETPLPAGMAESRKNILAQLNLPAEIPLVLYAGSMGRKHDLAMVIRAARRLDGQGPFFVLCGDGPLREQMAEESKGLANVRFIPLQEPAGFHALLSLACVHLIPQRAEAQDLALPSKLANITAHGGVAVASAWPGSALAEAVLAAGGAVVPPGDDAALAQQVKNLIADPEDRGVRSLKARMHAQRNCNKDTILNELHAALLRACHQDSAIRTESASSPLGSPAASEHP